MCILFSNLKPSDFDSNQTSFFGRPNRLIIDADKYTMNDIEAAAMNGSNGHATVYDEDYDGGNSTARLFERTRIQVLAGSFFGTCFLAVFFYLLTFFRLLQTNAKACNERHLQNG